MRALQRVAVSAIVVLGVGPLLATSAGAAPSKAKSAQFDVIDCGNGPVPIVSNGGQNVDKTVFTPGHVLDGNGVVIPDTFVQTFTITDQTTSTILFSGTETDAKGNSTQTLRDPIHCTFSGSQSAPATADDVASFAQQGITGVTVGDIINFTFSGTATGFAPRHR